MNSTSLSRCACALLALDLTASLLAGPPAQIPRGVFSLAAAGAKTTDAVLQNPNVDGVSIRLGWADLEPNENVYDWTFLDSEVARAAAAGKPVLLRIGTQNGKPAWVTDAITKAGGTFVTFSDSGDDGPVTIPVFWDPTFLAKKKAMIAAVGAHFKNNADVQIVCASFANASSEDWSVPHSSGDVAIWKSAGYTTEKMLDAGKQIIDATMAAFPNQFVTLAVGSDGDSLDPNSNYVAETAVATANASWPGRLIVQKNTISTFNPSAPGTGTQFEPIWLNRPAVGGQMLDACYDDSSYRVNQGVSDNYADILKRSVDLSVSYGLNYLEIYQKDVLYLPDTIAYAHTALQGQSKPLNTSVAPKAPTGLSINRPPAR